VVRILAPLAVGTSVRLRYRPLSRLCLLALALTLWAQTQAGTPEISKLVPWNGGATPPLKLQQIDGHMLDLTGLRGKVVLVNFWATWCEPCRHEMASMQKLKDRFAPGSVSVLAVNYGEDLTVVRDFLKRVPVKLDILLDSEARSPEAWRVRVLPTSFLVGPNGRVERMVVGEYDWSSAEAFEVVKALLQH
jgi:thiol-disulfide isomerase/thioredoxin